MMYQSHMKIKRYFLLSIVLLLLLGTALTIGLVSSRRIMLDLIKEQARSLLSVVASTQENLIFAEARLEDEFIDKLIGVCAYLETHRAQSDIEGIRESFDFNSIIIYDARTKKMLVTSGTPAGIAERIFEQSEPISFEYFTLAKRRLMRFVYVFAQRIYQIELPADDIQEFRTEFGINKIMNMIAVNPMVVYLVLQDEKGILFATPNVQAISRIDDDPALVQVMSDRAEASRIEEFNEIDVLELVRPFVVEDELVGIFRIGISLDNYHHHIRRTEGQLIILFLILFGAGFVLFLLFMNYQSYANIKELFDRTLGAVEDGVLLVNSKRVINGVNKMFCSMSAFSEDMLVGNRYDAVLVGDPFDVDKVLSEGRKISDEKMLFGRHIQYDTYPLSDNRQRVTGVITILHDVSKIRAFEKEREEAERLIFLGNLVANFAHEIKNPLNGLSIATQRLTREFPGVDEEYTRLTEGLKKEIDTLNRIVNDFLTLARPKMREKAPFKVSTVLEKVRATIAHELSEYDITLEFAVDSDLEITGNADDFRRAVLNVFLNAIEAVNAVEGRSRAIRVKLVEEGKTVLLTISDNGIGMDEEERERIFSPYFTTKKSGTGLGLYIAQKIIKDHGGKIRIESKKSKGTAFTIVFER